MIVSEVSAFLTALLCERQRVRLVSDTDNFCTPGAVQAEAEGY